MGMARFCEAASNATSQPDSKKRGRCADFESFWMNQHELFKVVSSFDQKAFGDMNGQETSSCFLYTFLRS